MGSLKYRIQNVLLCTLLYKRCAFCAWNGCKRISDSTNCTVALLGISSSRANWHRCGYRTWYSAFFPFALPLPSSNNTYIHISVFPKSKHSTPVTICQLIWTYEHHFDWLNCTAIKRIWPPQNMGTKLPISWFVLEQEIALLYVYPHFCVIIQSTNTYPAVITRNIIYSGKHRFITEKLRFTRTYFCNIVFRNLVQIQFSYQSDITHCWAVLLLNLWNKVEFLN